MFPIPVFVLFGPTASGKTELLRGLFAPEGGVLRKGLGKAEVISADSMQVYRGMDIGTAKPSPEERARIPHHLIDIRNPDEQFNAGDFVRLADECCAEIAARGALPIVSGGAGFYLKNFILGLPEAPPSDAGIRAALKEEMRLRGAAALMEELVRVDPESGRRIHTNDTYRLLRALEVFRLSGRPLSSYTAPGLEPARGEPGRKGRYRFLIAGLERDRAELYRRIDLRCAEMFRAGLPAELARLTGQGYGPKDPGLRAIGYREFFTGESPENYRLAEDPAAVEARVAQNSRRYAKRQITYFASIPGVRRLELSPGRPGPAGEILALVENFLAP
ncbi:MAG: tRNA (adenosine(37)-N6)-dimethylallyltransferase MiaA [Treponema sp.]|jgi:tRNA dimethylallyltransferase|nr:tRNA (adenosine(37)-N6)-dimethylallyltransferase MiaA [Treponema sp.]